MKSKVESPYFNQNIAISNLKTSNKNYLFKLFSLGIVLSTFLHQYSSLVVGVTLGEFLLLLLVLMIFVSNGFSFKAIKITPFVSYFFFCLTLSSISVLIQGSFQLFLITRWIRYSSYALIFLYMNEHYDILFGLKIYRFFCYFVSLYVLVQYVLFVVARIYIPIKILPIPWSRLSDTEELLLMATSSYFRAYGVFAEPGYTAKFLLPGLFLSVSGWIGTHKKTPFLAILIGLALIATTSLQGIIVGLFTLLIWPLMSIDTIKKNIKFLRVGIGILLLLITLFIFGQRTGLTGVAIRRIQGISLDSTGSTGIRLFRGFALYWHLPFIYKVFGIGLGNASFFVGKYGITTYFDSSRMTDTALGYFSGISGILVESGLVGAVLFIYMLIKILKRLGKEQRIILYQYLLLLSAGGSLFGMTSIFYFSFLKTSENRINYNMSWRVENVL